MDSPLEVTQTLQRSLGTVTALCLNEGDLSQCPAFCVKLRGTSCCFPLIINLGPVSKFFLISWLQLTCCQHPYWRKIPFSREYLVFMQTVEKHSIINRKKLPWLVGNEDSLTLPATAFHHRGLLATSVTWEFICRSVKDICGWCSLLPIELNTLLERCLQCSARLM